MQYRRILLIGYSYPPGGGVGSVRIAKFAKYLPDQWDIHVLTTPRETVNRNWGNNNGNNATIHEVPPLWPDAPKEVDQIRWVPRLANALYQLNREYSFDCFWQTADPFLPLSVVPLITNLVKVPYIVDLRDPWTLRPIFQDRTIPGKLYDYISKPIEHLVLKNATAVTMATSGMTERYSDNYPSLKTKFHTIQNGYDPEEYILEKTKRENSSSGLTVAYAGKFTIGMNCKPFLCALKELQQDRDVTFLHIGTSDEDIEELVSRLGLSNIYVNTGYLSRSELSKKVAMADVGLALTRDSLQIPTKVFDYIACETPILGCGSIDGSMAEVVESFEFGYIVQNETPQIKEALLDILDKQPVSLGEGPYEEFTRRNSANQLCKLINDICSKREL